MRTFLIIGLSLATSLSYALENPRCTNCQPPSEGPGVYTQQNPDGSSSTNYTTGDKNPYIVDPPNNNNAAIQPFVYAEPPLPPRR